MIRFYLLFISLFSPVAYADQDTERDALTILYHSTDGNNWITNTNWLQGYPCSGNWFGVTCQNGHVVKLDLWSNNLIGPLVPEINDLTQLKELWLEFNRISGEIPEELGDLNNLEVLILEKNLLEGAIPNSLFNLNNLKTLNLSRNDINGFISSDIGLLTNLERLDLRNNRLSGEIPVSTGNLIDLTYLDLSYNEFSGQIPTEFNQLTNLEYLFLGNLNNLDSKFPTSLLNITNLFQLDLSRSHYIGEVPSGILNLTNLLSLGLSMNALYSDDVTVNNFLQNKCEYCSGSVDWSDNQTNSPDSFQVSTSGDSTMSLIWNPVTFKKNGGYQIAMSESIQGEYTKIAELDNKSYNLFMVDLLEPNREYFFKINSFTRAHNQNDRLLISEWSEPISASTYSAASETDVWVTISSPSEHQAVSQSNHLFYTIRVGNNGNNELNNVIFKHIFSEGLAPASFSYSCQVIQGSATCPTKVAGHIDYLLDLPVGSILEFNFNGFVHSTNPGELFMAAAISPPNLTNDINIENNSDFIHFDWIFTDNFEVVP
jgi:uncharacterized repeat protein (TIGR01451 family)